MEIKDYSTADLEEIVRGKAEGFIASNLVVLLAKKELKRRTPSKALCKKIEDGLVYTGIMGSGEVYWRSAGHGTEIELRTVTYVSENGKSRTRKIARWTLKDDVYLVCAIQRKYPKVTGFFESMNRAWDYGHLPMTMAEISVLVGEGYATHR